ncbi:dihydropyrimidine dehydrogenase (NAD+) subunit PreT [Natronincola peptidivorans]|uniref:Dihydropyrimidine dehydrogenase (NAD+) subunit PreT n=1 Tax=Natronincola peptidivorans TaxID=426128 RepID=A0A1H9ZZL6_9FIRM|nr:NAD(P)-dependent oxidoreductase [Natronincola peptidivorans]SES87282.1 dihydropyrimidine dehydrogenase (NAD+) subunit PreT [Natronincola peptidivorans]
MEKKEKYLKEVEAPFTSITAMEEASRCLLCHDAPCSTGCPAGTDPGKFIRSIRFRNFKGAAETIRGNNILGGVCARVCPYDKTCEEACSRTGIDKPIEIGRLQRFVTDFEKATGFKVLDPVEATKEKVAVVGAGPAGLATAASLALKGYSVTVFEEKPEAGGVLTYGIAPGRLPQEVVNDEVQYVKDLGVSFAFNCKVGKDVTVEALKEEGYEAFFVGVGMQLPKLLDVPGKDLQGVTNAVEFLGSAKPNQGDVEVGERVIVIGGGDVAMDCAVTAKLLGDRVTVLYRRSMLEAPANKKELKHAQDIGVHFIPEFNMTEILGENGKVCGVKGLGRDGESTIELKADMVIFAIGQDAEDVTVLADIAIDDKKLVVVEENTCKTNVDGVFAAGDIVNGGKTVVEAVAEGKVAAEGIDQYLTALREMKATGAEIAVEKEGGVK